ncbi:MAG: hypothetical protein JWL90_97 [Chthoniobacteraceae bacterium]|nr:hypothetical protein [Chthoniobacteraceae bacterium]
MAAYHLRSMNRFASAAGALIDRIRINTITRQEREGRVVWIKRRRPAARLILGFANGFFHLATAPLRALADPLLWQRWEVESFNILHAPEFHAFSPEPASAGADELPGVNLTIHLDGGTITPLMAAAAGRELHRAHQCHCPQFKGLWSHGDPHLGNFIYDDRTDRARLIDFEVMHLQALPAKERHSDDLLIFLQDMAGRIRSEAWMPCAEAFLKAYANPELTGLLLKKLKAPRWGFARLWWIVRLSYISGREWRARFEKLRCAIQSGSCSPDNPSAAHDPSGFLIITQSSTG